MTEQQRELMRRFNMDPGEVRPGVKRKRCRKCRGFLWGNGKKTFAIDGLYCTLTCSPWTQAEQDAFNAWWDLVFQHCDCHGSTGRKTMYESEQEAIENIRVPLQLRAYACPKKRGVFHLTKVMTHG